MDPKPAPDPPAPTPDLTQRERNTTDVWRFRLENGLRVWAHERPRSGTLALLMQVPVGLRHETRQNNGVAHFVEHLVFTGTAKWPEEQAVLDTIRRVGGYVNARTSYEDTVYYLHLKADDLELGLEWLAEVLFRPTLVEEKYEKERGVILQEKGGEFGRLGKLFEWLERKNLGYDVFWAVRRRLFPDSALLMPVIGTDESLRKVDYPTVVAFYRAHYVPNNMTLIAVGDLEVTPLRAAVERHLGGFAASAALPETQPLEIDARPFDVRLHGPSINDRGQMLIGGVLGGSNHPDRYAWAVLSEILDNALTEEIRHQRGLVYGINAGVRLYREAGFMAIYTAADSDRFGEIQQVIEKHLQRAATGALTAEEIAQAKAALRGQAMLELESNLDMGWWLRDDALMARDDDTDPLPNYFAGIAAVTAADLQRVVRDDLAPEKRFRVIHRPAVTPKRLRPWLAGFGAGLLGGMAALVAWRGRRRLHL